MSTTTFTNVVSSSTTAVGDFIGAYWPVIVPFIIGVIIAIAFVRRVRGGKLIRRF